MGRLRARSLERESGERGRAGERGQTSVEWLALIALLALVFAALVASGVRLPGTALAESIAGRLLCAVGAGACGEKPVLVAAYGPEIAAEVRRHAPGLVFERGETVMPVDFRRCRRRRCAALPDPGRSDRGRPDGPRPSAAGVAPAPVAFTRVIDCRGAGEADLGDAAGPDRGEAAEPGQGGVVEPDLDCPDGDGGPYRYIQYWFYYPQSASFQDVPILAERGFHPHDWESFQVRIGPDGGVEARASSHHGHNNRRSVVNWASDAGIGPLNELVEKAGLRPAGGWGRSSGLLYVSAGSHAGNVRGGSPLRMAAYAPPEDLRLIPLETVADDVRLPHFDPVTPPWRKRLWRDPEAAGTS